PASVERTLHWGVQISAALAAIHDRGLLHGDIKPANVVLLRHESDEGTTIEQIKVFGFCNASIGASVPFITKLHVWTPEFMSPEQCHDRSLDPRSDIYACGCVLFYLCTGEAPFFAESSVAVVLKQVEEIPAPPSSINPVVTPELDALILRALEKDPAKRFQNA